LLLLSPKGRDLDYVWSKEHHDARGYMHIVQLNACAALKSFAVTISLHPTPIVFATLLNRDLRSFSQK